MVTQIFPTKTPEAAYPDLLRMGHVFVTSMGQRAFVDGLYGALDFAFGGDGWYYVLNKTDPRTGLFERVRFAKFDFEGKFDPNIYLSIDGQYDEWDEETFPGPVCCDSDRNGTLFFTDEHANKVVTLDTTGAVTNHWGEPGDEPGQLNAAAGIEWQPDGTCGSSVPAVHVCSNSPWTANTFAGSERRARSRVSSTTRGASRSTNSMAVCL